MRFVKDFIVQLIIGVIIAALMPIVTALLSNNIVIVGIVAAIAIVLLFVLVVCLLLKSPDFSKYENTSTSKTRYSILIVDDEFGSRKTRINESFRTYFDGWDILFLKTVNDARILEAFDIVILDILNANETQDDTLGIFDDVHHLYPEKYIVAMSQNSSECMNLCEEKHLANSSLPKPIIDGGKLDYDKWKSEIKKKIDFAFEELDLPGSYWSSICSRLSTTKERELAQHRYALFIQKHSNFKKKNGWLLWK